MAEDDAPKIEAPVEEGKAETQAAPPTAPVEAVAEQVLLQTAAPPEAAPPPPAPEVSPPPPAPTEAALPPPAPAPGWDGPLLRIEGVVKTFGGFRAVDGVSLDIHAGEFFALLGPSGCGKTTLLRMLAGFETPDQGRILLGGKDIAHVLPHERPINMVCQS